MWKVLVAACPGMTKKLAKNLSPALRQDVHPKHIQGPKRKQAGDFTLVLAKALRWPHYWVGRALLLGSPITGVMESTGVLRPRDEPRKVEEFDCLRADILAENKRWL
jgi:hypothetical protein